MPTPMEALKATIIQAEMLLNLDSETTDKLEPEMLLRAGPANKGKFLFITPKMYKQLKDALKDAVRAVESNTADMSTIFKAKANLELAIRGAQTDRGRPVRESIVITYIEELLLKATRSATILDEFKNEKPVDAEVMRSVLRSVREELSESSRAYTASGGCITHESVARLLKKLEDSGIKIQESEKQKLGAFGQQSPASRHSTRF